MLLAMIPYKKDEGIAEAMTRRVRRQLPAAYANSWNNRFFAPVASNPSRATSHAT